MHRYGMMNKAPKNATISGLSEISGSTFDLHGYRCGGGSRRNFAGVAVEGGRRGRRGRGSRGRADPTIPWPDLGAGGRTVRLRRRLGHGTTGWAKAEGGGAAPVDPGPRWARAGRGWACRAGGGARWEAAAAGDVAGSDWLGAAARTFGGRGHVRARRRVIFRVWGGIDPRISGEGLLYTFWELGESK